MDVDVDRDVGPEAEALAQPGRVVESVDQIWEIVLETPTERFLISPCPVNEERVGGDVGDDDDAEKNGYPTRRYNFSRIIEGTIISSEQSGKDEGQPPPTAKPDPPPVEAKPAPPTWSTPPAESDRTPTKKKSQSPPTTKPKPSKPTPKVATKLPRAKASVKVLSSDRGHEHVRFLADGVSVEGMDDGVINVKRWKWAVLEEFVAA